MKRPSRGRILGLSPDKLAGLRQALIAVVEEGTARGSRNVNLAIAGKTGTAQNSHGKDHGWFIGFAPAENPTIVIGASWKPRSTAVPWRPTWQRP